jgi:hypothetical protein
VAHLYQMVLICLQPRIVLSFVTRAGCPILAVFSKGGGFGFRTRIIEIERLNFQGKKSRKEPHPCKNREDAAPEESFNHKGCATRPTARSTTISTRR